MARSNRHDSDEETDFFEEYEQALKERVKSLKKVEDATDAKALIALSEKLTKTKFKIYEDFQKKAKKIVEEMDEVMRVFVAQESLLPKNCGKITWHPTNTTRLWCANTVTL